VTQGAAVAAAAAAAAAETRVCIAQPTQLYSPPPQLLQQQLL